MRPNAMLMMLSDGRMTENEMLARSVVTDVSAKKARASLQQSVYHLRKLGLLWCPAKQTYELTEAGREVVRGPVDWWDDILDPQEKEKDFE